MLINQSLWYILMLPPISTFRGPGSETVFMIVKSQARLVLGLKFKVSGELGTKRVQ